MSWLLRDGDVLASVEDRRRGWQASCRGPGAARPGAGADPDPGTGAGPGRGLVRAGETPRRRQRSAGAADHGRRPPPARPPTWAAVGWWWPRPGPSSDGACKLATASRSAASERAAEPAGPAGWCWWAPPSGTSATCRPRRRRPGRRRRHLLRGHPAHPETAECGGDPRPSALVAMHQHNEAASAAYAVELATGGATVAVVTDAGMPGISDPGRTGGAGRGRGRRRRSRWSRALRRSLTALVASGLPAERFCFEGFLPRRGQVRGERLRQIAARDCTTVLYEAPHRVAAHPGRPGRRLRRRERRMAVGRELTKLHEELWRGTLGEAVEWVAGHEPRGEWVLVVAGAGARLAARPSDAEIIEAPCGPVSTQGDRPAPGRRRRGRRRCGVPKRDVYQLGVGLADGRRATPTRLNPIRTRLRRPGTLLSRGPVLRHHPHLLRQRRPPHRPRLHHRDRRRRGPLAPAAAATTCSS